MIGKINISNFMLISVIFYSHLDKWIAGSLWLRRAMLYWLINTWGRKPKININSNKMFLTTFLTLIVNLVYKNNIFYNFIYNLKRLSVKRNNYLRKISFIWSSKIAEGQEVVKLDFMTSHKLSARVSRMCAQHRERPHEREAQDGKY